MTITLELPEALEKQLRKEAARKGISLDRYIILNLEDKDMPGEAAGYSEPELLKKINLDLGIPAKTWDRYYFLVNRLQAEQLSKREHRELLALTDVVEAANVERLKYLIALAQLRGVSLEQVMSDLGIHPRTSDDQ